MLIFILFFACLLQNLYVLFTLFLSTPLTLFTGFGETGSDFMEKILSGFPSDVFRLLCLHFQ